eukprot:20486-Heterococcus_DN1.PRE.1
MPLRVALQCSARCACTQQQRLQVCARQQRAQTLFPAKRIYAHATGSLLRILLLMARMRSAVGSNDGKQQLLTEMML